MTLTDVFARIKNKNVYIYYNLQTYFLHFACYNNTTQSEHGEINPLTINIIYKVKLTHIESDLSLLPMAQQEYCCC